MKTILLFLIILIAFTCLNAQKMGTLYTTNEGLPDNKVYAIEKDINNNLWIGTKNGLSMYDGNSFTNYFTTDSLPHNKVYSLASDSFGNIYIGTELGAATYNGSEFIKYDSLIGQKVYDILHDQQNRIWFATYNNGIYCYDSTNWQHFTNLNGLISNYFCCLFEDHIGNIYAGSRGTNVLHKFDGTSWSIFEVDTISTGICYISGINEDDNGYIWVCGKSLHYIDTVNYEYYYHISRFDGSNFISYKIDYNLLYPGVPHTPLIFNNNNLLAGSKLDGIVQFNEITTEINLLNEDNFFYNNILELYLDGNNLWVGTINGLVLIENFNQFEIHNSYEFLDTNNYSVRFNAMGDLFWDLKGESQSEIPKNSGKTCLFAGNLWVGGLDSNDSLYVAAENYYPNTEFWAGPIADNYDINYYSKYNRLWKVNKSDIDYHIVNYSNGAYQMPEVIENWPGNGNTNNGEAYVLAPYVDANANSIYDPQNGDYPKIRGDQAVYFIINDTRLDTHQTTLSLPMGIEVHAMAYSYNNVSSENLNNTFFINYQIFNRSNKDYHDVYLGLFTDFDIGDFSDDYIGCDSAKSTFFAYNGDSEDGDGSGHTYGINPPAQGVTFLSTPLSSFMYYNNGSCDMCDPQVAIEFYRYMQAIWKNGLPLTFGGTGHGGADTVNFMFDINSGWTEETENNIPFDRRGIGSAGPFILNSGDNFCIDVAYPWARDTVNGESVQKLLNAVDEIQAFYDAQNFDCFNLDGNSINVIQSNNNFILYPNPTTGILNIYTDNDQFTINVYNINGSMLLSKNSQKQIDLSKYSNGIYIVKIITESTAATKKIILE